MVDRDIVEVARAKLMHAGLADPADLVGCSQEEIEDIEARLGLRLPASYRSWLAGLGRSAGPLWLASGSYYPSLLRITSELRIALSDEGLSLPPDAMAFREHELMLFAWFRCDGSGDPPVHTSWFGGDDSDVLQRAAPSFSAYALAEVDDLIRTLPASTWREQRHRYRRPPS